MPHSSEGLNQPAQNRTQAILQKQVMSLPDINDESLLLRINFSLKFTGPLPALVWVIWSLGSLRPACAFGGLVFPKCEEGRAIGINYIWSSLRGWGVILCIESAEVQVSLACDN